MPSFQSVTILGHVGREPEMRFTPNGNPTTNFSVAVSERHTKDGESSESTEWFSVITWNKLAETCNQYVTKGSLVLVVGKIRTHSWDGTDGVKHYKTELIADRVLFLNKKSDSDEVVDEKPTEDIPA